MTLQSYANGLDLVLEEKDDQREYTAEEEAVLSVHFPPWYFSTHGLSRPATPDESDNDR